MALVYDLIRSPSHQVSDSEGQDNLIEYVSPPSKIIEITHQVNNI